MTAAFPGVRAGTPQDEGGPDVYVHFRSIQGSVTSLTEGQKVEYIVTQGQKGT
ncbi:cold shock domain-containing protein, partial [Streptomyces sp. NPDC051994]|uniref:cold-shock protein n=1 Tax=unclassified Streptomyces TaxID=2593676 RepID=UPI00344A2657